MLMGDEVYVKPASRESRLVMVRLEPKAKKKKPKRETNKTNQGGNNKNMNKTLREQGSTAMNHFDQLMEAYCDWEGPHDSSCA
jgi:hypothetical protein